MPTPPLSPPLPLHAPLRVPPSYPTTSAALPSRSPAAISVAVVGAGAAGLVAARELDRWGHSVAIFERAATVGGTWVYTPAVESDPLGVDPGRAIVHSSLYYSLRTNLPREVMGFLDYPFVPISGDRRRFPGHQEVLRYLQDFARDFSLYQLIRFQTEIVSVGLEEGGKWTVRSRGDAGDAREVFDAVVVCNGHYTEPRIAEIPGIDAWPGKQLHSHNYRVPEQFHDQVVVIIGNSASAVDISRDISGFAKEVRIASRSPSYGTPIKQHGYDNLWLQSMVKSVHEDGTALFLDGSSVHVDVILHCTGYKYHFPFLETNDSVSVDDNRVGPLFKHIFPPSLAPSLSFIGIPWKVVPFPMFELQSKWVAGVLSGQIDLPTQVEMMEDVKAFYSEMEASGSPKRYTHNMENYQFEYGDWLATQCGYPTIEEWRKQMNVACGKNKIARPESYRDEWDDDVFIALANNDFQKFSSIVLNKSRV